VLEQIITIGLRGENDSEMVSGQDQAIDLLNKIIPAQRKITADSVNPAPTKVPQVWALYTDYYLCPRDPSNTKRAEDRANNSGAVLSDD
jgi:hypothetical protein